MIAALLSTSVTEARQRLRHAYDAIESSDTRPIVLFGCGPLGHRTGIALAAAQRAPIAFADNNPVKWGTTVYGISVLPPADVVAAHGETAIFVVTIYNSAAVCAQLREFGCRYVLPFASFYHGQAEIFLPWYSLDDPTETLRSRNDLLKVASLWADEASRAEYVAQVAWRLGLPSSKLTEHDPPSECYFPQNLFVLDDNAFVVDCGAFDGDSLRLLLDRKNAFGAFLGLEPDPETYDRLTDFIATLSPAVREKIMARQCVVAEAPGTLRFDASGSVSSGINAAGNTEILAQTLDDLLLTRKTSLIKMDIEGAEAAALRGAKNILLRDRPILAISAYHKASDLWTIPLLIKSIVPEYDIYLRRYAEDCWELICYAIPPSRQSSGR
jgi:FkbM family methyltransferase